MLISKIIFKTWKIYYFDVFSSEKYFKKQSLPHSQTNSWYKSWYL